MPVFLLANRFLEGARKLHGQAGGPISSGVLDTTRALSEAARRPKSKIRFTLLGCSATIPQDAKGTGSIPFFRSVDLSRAAGGESDRFEREKALENWANRLFAELERRAPSWRRFAPHIATRCSRLQSQHPPI